MLANKTSRPAIEHYIHSRNLLGFRSIYLVLSSFFSERRPSLYPSPECLEELRRGETAFGISSIDWHNKHVWLTSFPTAMGQVQDWPMGMKIHPRGSCGVNGNRHGDTVQQSTPWTAAGAAKTVSESSPRREIEWSGHTESWIGHQAWMYQVVNLRIGIRPLSFLFTWHHAPHILLML